VSSFKIGQPTHVSISNINDKSKETELQRYDINKDGMLDVQEASRYHASKTRGEAPRGMEEVFDLAGGRQHDIKTYHNEYYNVLSTYAPNWKGDFHIPGYGAGNVRIGPSYGDRMNVLVDCDLMNRDFLEKGITSASLVIGPKGFDKEQGSNVGEAVHVPLNIATRESYQSFSRGGGSHTVPEKKFLAATMDMQGMRDLANGKDLNFYIRLETNDGKTLYVNKDGQAFKNFEIKNNEIKGQGNP
jgi:hypothetical protein